VKKILLFLPHGFETYEACVFIDVIGWNLTDGDGSTKLFTAGFTREVVSSFDQRMVVDFVFEEIRVADFDALAMPGGFVEYDFYREAYDERLLELIREFDRQGKLVASICVGALPLGRSGVLAGRRCTTYNQKDRIRQKTLAGFGAKVVNEPLVEDGNIITSWNPSTGMEVAFRLLERLTDKPRADFIREIMGFGAPQ
jgi:4-methyl-5(b-hydroxyethyl)-thiazole monophosphate biosynthesis